jgi:hypothetical protein
MKYLVHVLHPWQELPALRNLFDRRRLPDGAVTPKLHIVLCGVHQRTTERGDPPQLARRPHAD